jgi:hypothetical protein
MFGANDSESGAPVHMPLPLVALFPLLPVFGEFDEQATKTDNAEPAAAIFSALKNRFETNIVNPSASEKDGLDLS